MKKVCMILRLALFLGGGGSILFAGSIDHNNNFSAGYIRTFNRNAVTDSADAAVYNPAGVAKLDNGLHVSVNSQFIVKNYSHESSTDTYAAKNPTPFLPSAFVVFSQNRWGVFGAFIVPAGGGSLKYKDGVADLNEDPTISPNDPNGKLYSAYYSGTLGGVFAINDMISISLCGRYMFTKQTVFFETETPVVALGNVTKLLDTESTSSGFGGIIGLNIAPLAGLNIGIRYETITKLEWEYKKVEGPLATLAPPNGLGLSEGDKYDRDLPPLLGVGVSYMIRPQFKAETSFMYYFTKQADWDGDEDDHKNGYELGVAFEYEALKKLKASVGFLYINQGADEDSYAYLKPALDAFSVCGGGIYEVMPGLNLELGVSGTFYTEDDGNSQLAAIPVTLNKTVLNIAVGANYKILL